jgi:hypothetical protein
VERGVGEREERMAMETEYRSGERMVGGEHTIIIIIIIIIS